MAQAYKGWRGPNNAVYVKRYDNFGTDAQEPQDIELIQTRKIGRPRIEWGYDGEGPRTLAASILFDHLGNIEEALALAPRYSLGVIAALPLCPYDPDPPRDPMNKRETFWIIKDSEVEEWVAKALADPSYQRERARVKRAMAMPKPQPLRRRKTGRRRDRYRVKGRR